MEARTEVTSKRTTGNASEVVLGKNARKRLRRKQENELRQSEHVPPEATATDESVKLDAGEAVKLPKKKKPTGRKFEVEKPKEQREAQQELLKLPRETRNRQRQKSATANETDAPVLYQKAKQAEKSADRMVARNARKEANKATETLERPPKTISEKAGTGPSPPSPHRGPLPPVRSAEPWQVQKRALQTKFPEGWNPRKKLSPDALEGIRALHRQFPETYTTATLVRHFQVSPEAIRRILKSSWQATPEVEEDRQARWFGRGKQVWSRWAELGRKPPKRWQAEGIRRDPMSWPGGRKRQMARQQLQTQTRQSRQAFQSQLSAEGTRDHSVGETDKSSVSYAGTQRTVRKESAEAEPSRARTSSKGRKIRLQLAGLDPESKA
ncbi:Required for respiratory growth protein 9 mitochondrial [Sporothrix epigloea]|uniref:Required for respiratory growth protein 9, mitochondrial n=1 Tax=Sporothrix epigloea TaxID=1892477 RepID=A0ABP0DTW7_9PEZI